MWGFELMNVKVFQKIFKCESRTRLIDFLCLNVHLDYSFDGIAHFTRIPKNYLKIYLDELVKLNIIAFKDNRYKLTGNQITITLLKLYIEITKIKGGA